MSRHSKLARTAGAIALAACVTFALTPAAIAAGNDWNHHGWGHNDWHGYNNRNSSSFGIYLGGPGYYAPPPTYYRPAAGLLRAAADLLLPAAAELRPATQRALSSGPRPALRGSGAALYAKARRGVIAPRRAKLHQACCGRATSQRAIRCGSHCPSCRRGPCRLHRCKAASRSPSPTAFFHRLVR